MKKNKSLLALLAVLVISLLAGCAEAAAEEVPPPGSDSASSIVQPITPEAPPAITVRYLEGEAVYLRGGAELPLTTGTLLYEGDAVKTGADGLVVLKLDGDKQVQLAPDSHVEISGFQRGEGRDKTLLVLHGGSIINILDAPLQDTDSYEVETPALVMAIRGTIASVSSAPGDGPDRVLLFEGSSTVRAKATGEEATIAFGFCAWTQDGRLEHSAFTGADLNSNESWFLYDAAYDALFDQPTAKIPDRLAPLLGAEGDAQSIVPGGQPGGSNGTAPNGGSEQAQAPSPSVTPPTHTEGNDSGMDEAAFRAIEQEFLQAKQDYNSGKISKNDFLAIKYRYIEAKQLYYGE